MSKVSKGGRVPASSKSADLSDDSLFNEFDQSILNLDSTIKAELDEKGLAYRWINATQYKAGGNFHKSGWRAYRREVPESERGSMDFGYGVSPEGYLIRGDLVLAVKPKEQQERYRKYLSHRAAVASGKVQRNIEEFREKARSHGATVHEGYEENE